MTELVLMGNRVVAHGTTGTFFCVSDGCVVNISSGRLYADATVAFFGGSLPADIDDTGYEYRAGQFLRCAPYGEGDGNIAVADGDEGRTIKDSGLALSILNEFAKFESVQSGTFVRGDTLVFNSSPQLIIAWSGGAGQIASEGSILLAFRGASSSFEFAAETGELLGAEAIFANTHRLSATWTENSVRLGTASTRVYNYIALVTGSVV